MKFNIIVLLISWGYLSAQPDLQFIKIKNGDGTIDLSIVNNTESSYGIKVKIDLTSMEFSESLPMDLQIQAQETKVIGKLKPLAISGSKYTINYKATELEGTAYTTAPNITIYTKNRHKRSTQLLIFLDQRGISHNEINTSYNEASKQIYRNMIARRKLDPEAIRLPVVIHNGEVFYDIKNIKEFCEKELKNEGRIVAKKDRKY
jgi:hypothetical protein